MTTHSPTPGTPQTRTKAHAGSIVGALGFMVSNLVIRWLTGLDPELGADPMWAESINIVVSGAIGGGLAWFTVDRTPNRPLPGPTQIRSPQTSRPRSGPLPCIVGLPLALVLLAGCVSGHPDVDMTDEWRDQPVTWPTAETAEVFALIVLTELEAETGGDLSLLSDVQRARAARYCLYVEMLTLEPQVADLCAAVDRAP